MKLALRFSYFGDCFFGSQMQLGLRTVEGEFIAACRRLGLFEDWRRQDLSRPAVPTVECTPGARSAHFLPKNRNGRSGH